MLGLKETHTNDMFPTLGPGMKKSNNGIELKQNTLSRHKVAIEIGYIIGVVFKIINAEIISK